MRNKAILGAVVLGVSLMLTTLVVGCGAAGAPLSESLTVTLPDGSSADAQLGKGPESLANKKLTIQRSSSSGQSFTFLSIVFNEDGGIEEFNENQLARQIFGDRIILDGKEYPTAQQGLTYSGGVYGAGTEDGEGIVFEARINAYAARLLAARATASVTGTWVDDTTLTGTLEYSSETTLIDIPEANIKDSFDFTATVSDIDPSDQAS